MADRHQEAKESFRQQYDELARERPASARDRQAIERLQSMGYSESAILSVPESALMSLGCGNPIPGAELKAGEIVLDLGSGGGLDAFLAAQEVGPEGKVIGVDGSPEMVERAIHAATTEGVENVEFKLGNIEDLPVPDRSIDVTISNCVINHSPNRQAVFKEVWRVLRPDGRMYVADLVTDGSLPSPDLPGLEMWSEWLSVAAGKEEYVNAIKQAGFRDVTVLSARAFSGEYVPESLEGRVISLQISASK